MAGAQDTPEGRRARQEAGLTGSDGLEEEQPSRARARAARGRGARPGGRAAANGDADQDPGELLLADRPQPRHPYGRRDGVPNAMVASAARIGLQDRRAIENTRRRRQAWQTEAWDYFDEVGEIGYTDTFLANLMSKLRLYPAVRLDPKEAPIAVDDPASKVDRGVAKLAVDTLARLRSVEGGQSAILRELSLNLEVAGECYLHGHVEVEGEGDPNEPTTPVVPVEQAGGPEGPNPNDVEDWQIRSVDELVITGDSFSLRRGPGVKMLDPLPDSDLVVRIWERHPRFSEMATCAMRRVLAECEALLLLSREVRATSKSRLSNGILLIPSELSFGPVDPTRDPGDGEEADDPFDAELQDAMITPIQEEGSASAVVPLTLRGPAEFLQHVNHLVLDKSLDPVLDARIEQRVLRIARGLNMPVEVTTGLMSTTFANAVQVKRSEFEDHIEPRAVLVCDAITSGYFQWALESAGVEPEQARQIFVWFDPAAVVESPDPAEQAGTAHKDMLISDQAYRRYLGYSEEDKPSDDEKLLRLVLNAPRMEPSILGQILVRSGLFKDLKIPGPASGVLGDTDPVSAMPAPGAPPAPPKAPAAVAPGPPPPAELPPGRPSAGTAPARGATPAAPPVTAAASAAAWAALGPALVGIDQHLRARVIAKLDEAMHTTLERAGNRLRSRIGRDKGALRRAGLENTPAHQLPARIGRTAVESTGLSETDLLDGAFVNAVDSVTAWMAAAQAAALRAVERVSGPLPAPTRAGVGERHKADLLQAADWLVSNLRILAAQRLYDPRPRVGPGEDDGTVAVPTSLVRAAVAVAGGAAVAGGSMAAPTADPVDAAGWADVAGPVTDVTGEPLGGIGTGPTTLGVLGNQGGGVDGWQWDYGPGVRREFEPHLEIDGQTAEQPSGFQWGSAWSGWPENDNPFPGDHDGCMCDITPALVPTTSTLSEAQGEVEAMRSVVEAVPAAPAEALPSGQYDARLADFRRSIDSGVRASEALGDGTAQLVTYNDGRQAVVREVDPRIRDQADRDVLTARLGTVIGAKVPLVVDLGDGRVAVEHVAGTLGRDLPEATRQEVMKSEDAQRLGLLDRVTGNVDRDPGNWIVTPDGHVYGLPGLSTFDQKLSDVIADLGEAARVGLELAFPEDFRLIEGLFRAAELTMRAKQVYEAEQQAKEQETQQAFVTLGHKPWYDNMLDLFGERSHRGIETVEQRKAHERYQAAFARAFPGGGKYDGFVNHYSLAQLDEQRMRPLMTTDGQTGLLIWDHGDGRVEATGLFSTSANKGAGLALLRQAVAENGVNYVECFGPYLPNLYSEVGFRDVTVTPFNREFAPPGWNYALFDEPAYHSMEIPK